MTQTPDRAIAIAGVSGRMGGRLVEVTDALPGARLAAAFERPDHAWLGADLGTALGGTARGLTVTEADAAQLAGIDAIIDFTAPAASVALSGAACEAGCAHVVGTTGFSEADLAALAVASSRIPVVRAGNMSLGVNLLVQLTRQVARALGPDYDIEVVEAHHRHKVDAPSGTALMLGEAAAEGRGAALADISERGRDGITGARAPGAIGFAAIRGGDIVGEHDVVFAGDGERIVLRHVASDRSVFARGALAAALWAAGRAPGAYDMLDVLGLGDATEPK